MSTLFFFPSNRLFVNNNLGAVAVTGGLLNIIQWFTVTAFPVIRVAFNLY